MIKEALFSVIGPDIEGACFLDLFAGSGSVGIEALSRGATKAVFVDNSPKAVGVIYKNLSNCGFVDGYEVYRNDVLRAMRALHQRGAKFDYIYIDPPFTSEGIFTEVMKGLEKVDILNPQGSIIIRTPRHRELPASLGYLAKRRHKHYGESALHYYALTVRGGTNNDGGF